MKLSKKINIILLPVILVIFSIAGIFSYNILKNQATDSIFNKVHHEINNISGELHVTINELDFFSQLLLGSDNINYYLNNIKYSSAKHYYEKELINYIRQLNLTTGTLESFSLVNSKTGKVFFYTNLLDPFAEFDFDGVFQDHFKYFNEELQDKSVVQLSPKVYKFETVNAQNKFVLLRTFSLNQPITSTFFSKNYDIYTARFVVNTQLINKHTDVLKARFGDDVLLSVVSGGAHNSLILKNDSRIRLIDTESQKGYEINELLWNVKLLVTDKYLTKLYRPYQQLFIFIVVLVTLVTFFILKWLITSNIITPIAKLTKRVESSEIEEILKLNHRTGDNEVSVLTNRYHDLIVDLDRLAKRDNLTGLPNRNQFNSDLKRFIEYSKKYNEKSAVIYFDLDRFKLVNDVYGHQIGDEILKEFAQRLVESSVDLDWDNIDVSEFEFARVSGDEFTILFFGISDLSLLSIFSQKILALFEGGFKHLDNTFDIGASIGIAVYPDDALNAKILVNHANLAMFSAKKEKENVYRFYSNDLDSEIKHNEMIASHLRKALIDQNFKLVFMPIFDCKSGKICGAEVLLRATSEELLSIGPADFIPVAESSGIIKDIDYWVIESSFKTLVSWIKEFNFTGVLAINFSSWQLKNQEFVPKVAALLQEYNVPPHQIELEITETCFVPGEDRNVQMLSELHQLGVKLSLDDFGTGFTAFSQLVEYPIDTLKIDRMFVNTIDVDDNTATLVDKMVEIAKLYDLDVIAEGVETEAQLEHIKSIGCQHVQGYLLSKPISENEFLDRWNAS